MTERPSLSGARQRRAPLDRSDLVAGVGSVVVGIPVLLYATTMPTLGGGSPGPGLFPGIIGVLFMIFGAGLLASAFVRSGRAPGQSEGGELAAGHAAPAAPSNDELDPLPDGHAGETPTQDASTTLRVSTQWMNVAVVLGAIIFYVLVAEILGFIITMFVALSAIMIVLRSRVVVALVTAAAVTVLLYVVFQQLLLVQLPNGLLG